MQRSYDKPTNSSWAARGISEEAVINLPAVENLHRNIHSAPQVSTTTSYKHCSNIRSPYRVPNDLNVVQWTLFKQSLLMQTLRDAFSAFAPTYGSMFKMLDYKLDISRNQNLPFNSRMLTALAFLPTKDVRGFVAVCTEIRTNFGNVADELLAHFKDIYISNFRLNTPRNNPIFSKEL